MLALSAAGAFDSMPTWTYVEEDIEIEIGIIPVSREHRGHSDHRPIGIFPTESRWGSAASAVRRTIEKKATRYGAVGQPYLLALNILGQWGCDHDDMAQALIGPELVTVNLSTRESSVERRLDGAWHRARPRNRRVSAVLAFVGLVPWNLASCPAHLYLNPWAQYPITSQAVLRLPSVSFDSNTFHVTAGVLPGDILGIPPGWPGKLFG
jgi:hypothetical protein